MYLPRFRKGSTFFALASFFLLACQKNMDNEIMPAEVAAPKMDKVSGMAAMKGVSFYALTSSNQLVHYTSCNPLREESVLTLTGLQAGESLMAIDFRPATGQLYGVSSRSQVYVINLNSGAVTSVGSAFTPAINGSEVGFDFNPTVDRIRLVTSSGQNLRLNPETGEAIVDGSIKPATARVSAVAYINSMAGAASTTLYDIDAATDMLYRQNPPNNGNLELVGSLGVQATAEAGFDIAPDNSVAIAVLFGRGFEEGQVEESNGNKYRFYYINLQTGKAVNAGKTDREIIALAIPTMPVAYAVDDMNRLVIMNPSTTSYVYKNISGLMMGEVIVGMDMRPATAQLYALASSGRMYTINMANGSATIVGTGMTTPMLNGSSFGFDFNPTVDRIRVVSNTGQNLRLHPVTGSLAATDPNLNPGMPDVSAAAYTNSFAGSTNTTLYDVDVAMNMLYQQNPANAGTLVDGKSLGIDVEADNGFDIGGASNKAWGLFRVGGQNGLYHVDLSTGRAQLVMQTPFTAKGLAVGLGF
jgi:hypothetical protein